MLKQEWLGIWKDKKFMLSIAVMFIMPVLYSGMLLWAFWDPYGQLDDLPVALVNEDKGATLEGEEILLGDELIGNLTDSGTFKFIETSSDEAEQMLEDSEAYIMIKIPENFSAHATTLLDADPEKLALEYKVNEASNFLSSKIGDNAINQIRAEVNAEVSKTYAEQLFVAINKLSDGYGDAADGATKINDGVAELKGGTKDFEGYLQQLASSTVTLSDGTNSLVDGVSSAKSGAAQLADGSQKLQSGSEQLASGANDLQSGAGDLASGVTNYTAGVDQIATNQQALVEGQQTFQSKLGEAAAGSEQLATGATSVAAGTEQLATGIAQFDASMQAVLAQLPEEQKAALQASLATLVESSKQVANGAASVQTGAANLAAGTQQLVAGHATIVENSEKLAAGMNQVASNSAQLVAGAEKLAEGSSTLSSKMSEFNNGVVTVAGGVSSLNAGLGEIADGANKLATGTGTLSEKSGELADGSSKLVEGTEKLAEGAGELSTSLSDAHVESKVEASDKNYEMVASPVDVDKEVKNSVDNYGTGLAPYFISLGLFVGALLLTNVYPFVQPSIHPTGAFRWFISKCSVPFVVWIFQTAILSLILLYGLKINVTNVPLFILLMAVASFAFIAIVQLLVVLLNDVGRFIALVFLILQLSSSAGTFPVELLPKLFQSINAYMPMSYSVEALRHVISATDYGIVYTNIGILAVIGASCLLLSFGYFVLLYKRRYSKTIEA